MSEPTAFQPVLLDSARRPWLALEHALAELTPAAVLDVVEAAQLRGRGGAAFPTARKWRIAAGSNSVRKYVVANGGEHEPGSGKDRRLLESHPSLVLEGMALAAFATGASHGYLYLIEDMTDALSAAEQAIAAARASGWLGNNIHGSSFQFAVEVVRAPPTYVAGEETAALEVIEGRVARPRKKPPYPGEAGIDGLPTTVNNVETLAHVPGIVSRGADWFRALGVPGSSGTVLCTLPPGCRRPGVHEMPYAATLEDLIIGRGGGLVSGRVIKGILPAMSAAFLPGSAIQTGLSHDAMRDAGSTLGCGGISILEAGECALERTLEIARFFMAEQCGQCPPCRMETSTIAAVLTKLAAGEAGDYLGQIEKIAKFTARKGHCSLIEMAATPVLSALRLFPGDFAHHAQHGRCPA